MLCHVGLIGYAGSACPCPAEPPAGVIGAARLLPVSAWRLPLFMLMYGLGYGAHTFACVTFWMVPPRLPWAGC